jgi:transaldolase
VGITDEGKSSDMTPLDALTVRIFADGADLTHMRALAAHPRIAGFTTNPTLMRKAGVSDYRAFARDVLAVTGSRPVSFEVFSDEFSEMRAQANEIASWGEWVNVKIPVTNTRGDYSGALIRDLSADGVQLNITAVMTLEQVDRILESLSSGTTAYISIFAGRMADTGRDPVPHMAEAVRRLRQRPNTYLIWASPRELLNVFHADGVGCDIITVTSDILAKLSLVGKDLVAYSLDTVRMFREDAVKAGYRLESTRSQMDTA